MEPLIVLLSVTGGSAALSAAGISRLRPWTVPVRYGLATMFAMTGVAHFVGMRDELVAMVPPSLPAPGVLVTITGVLELAGAAGLVYRRTSVAAAHSAPPGDGSDASPRWRPRYDGGSVHRSW